MAHTLHIVIPMQIPIRHIRDVAVILDADLAAIYGVPTKRLNEQVKRNKDRFPADFVFRLTAKEWREVRANAAEVIAREYDKGERSQIATGSSRVSLRDQVARPYAFTEHGALMAANVLRSESPKSRSGVSPLHPPRQTARRRFSFSTR
ncbi:MAG: ORF6N domain-containing protein [Chthoniobacterales bacterium]